MGSPKLDNYHRVRGDRTQFTSGVNVTVDNNPNALRQRLWLETDRVYRLAAERLIKIKTNQQVKVAERDSSDDFSQEPTSAHDGPVYEVKFDKEKWTERVRTLSAAFSKYPELIGSSVYVTAQGDTRYFVNTEGSARSARARFRAGHHLR